MLFFKKILKNKRTYVSTQEANKLLQLYNKAEWEALIDHCKSKNEIIYTCFKGVALKELKDEKGDEILNDISQIEAKDSDETFSKGFSLFTLDKMDDALEEFGKLKENGLVFYLMGRLNIHSKSTALGYFEKSEKLGIEESLIDIGNIYLDQRHYLLALETFLKIPHHDEAQYLLGDMYLNGMGVEKDMKKALSYFKQSSIQGNSKSMYEMAKLMLQNKVPNGLTVLKESIKKGNLNAINFLANMHMKGEIVEKDEKKAIELFKAAAELGHNEAQFELGKLYQKGKGVEKDMNKALYLFKKAAFSGFSPAGLYLGNMYISGFDVPTDYKKGYEYIHEAAISEDPNAMFALGVLYAEGKGCEKDENLAYEWIEKAGRKGSADANLYLGKFYTQIPDLHNAAIDCFKAAALGGKLECFEHLASHYEMGDIVEKNDSEAFKYLLMGSEFGHDICQLHLGVNFLKGLGTQMNPEKGIEWITKSAEQNLPQAQALLGNIYLKGIGTPKNQEKAIFWLKKASDNQNKEAQKILVDLGIKIY